MTKTKKSNSLKWMFKSLDSFQKFQSGSTLWIVFFEPQRALFREINWRTGFLLQSLKGEPLSQAVLLDTQSIFPNNSLLCLPEIKDFWSGEVYKNWKKMNKPSVRVFLPLGREETELSELWPSSHSQDLSYYKEKVR